MEGAIQMNQKKLKTECEKNYSETFSSRIKQLRSSMNMTQVEFAKYIHTTQTTLSSYENLGKIPSLDVAVTISKSCHVSIDWLCGLSDNRELSPQIDTYKKYFKALIELLSVEYDTKDDKHLNPVFINTDKMDSDKDPFPILLSDDILTIRFLTDWNKMYNLLLSDTIDEELYLLWLNKELDKYDIPITGEKVKDI